MANTQTRIHRRGLSQRHLSQGVIEYQDAEKIKRGILRFAYNAWNEGKFRIPLSDFREDEFWRDEAFRDYASTKKWDPILYQLDELHQDGYINLHNITISRTANRIFARSLGGNCAFSLNPWGVAYMERRRLTTA